MIKTKYKLIILITILLCLTILLILGFNNNTRTPVTPFPASYQVASYPESQNDQGETAIIIKDYSVEIIEDSGYYIAEYKTDNSTREIYRWKIDLGYGIGGPSCNGVKYSPDKSFFTVCVSSAVVADHQWIPLIFDFNGDLVTDFSNIENFPLKRLADVSLASDNAGKTYPVSEFPIDFEWIDDTTLELSIYDSSKNETFEWIYKIGESSLVRK